MLEHSWFTQISPRLVDGRFEISEEPVDRLFHVEQHHELGETRQVRRPEEFSDKSELREFQHGPVRMESVLLADVVPYGLDISDGRANIVLQLDVILRDVGRVCKQQREVGDLLCPPLDAVRRIVEVTLQSSQLWIVAGRHPDYADESGLNVVAVMLQYSLGRLIVVISISVGQENDHGDLGFLRRSRVITQG